MYYMNIKLQNGASDSDNIFMNVVKSYYKHVLEHK